jgi:hypothetical protein
MASSSTDVADPNFFARVSVCFVGLVGRFHRAICSGVTAIRSK